MERLLEEHVGRPVGTLALIALNVGVYLATTYSTSFLSIDERVLWSYGYLPFLANSLEGVYRIFTSMFLHADPLHIFFNMYFLYIFGRGVEEALGTPRYLALYTASGFGAAMLHTATVGFQGVESVAIPAIGASGAISGVLGSYLIFYPTTPLAMCLFLPFPICGSFRASTFILFWFATQVLYGYFRLGGIAFFAHAGGFVSGIALSWLLARRASDWRGGVGPSWPGLLWQGVREGLGSLQKILLALLVVSLLAVSLYSYYLSADLERTRLMYAVDVRVSGSPDQPPGASSVALIMISREGYGFSASPIADDSVRILVNRLLYSGLIFNPSARSETREISGTYSPVISGVSVPFRVSMKASYDSNGVLVSGSGSASTYVVSCTPQGVCVRGGAIAYGWFSIASSGPIAISQISAAPLAIMSLVSLLSLYVILFKDRELSLSESPRPWI